MKKSELKKILKPIVKECIQEALLEEGVISVLIKEVVKGTSSTASATEVSKEQAAPTPPSVPDNSAAKQQLEEAKKRLLKSIGGDVDVFAGTAPLSDRGTPSKSGGAGGPLSGVASDDPGVDISSLAGNAGSIWKRLNEGKK